MNLQVTLPTSQGDLVLKNPTMSAAGTFGYAIEYERMMNLNCLGVIVPSFMAPTDGQPSTARQFYQLDYGSIGSFGTNNFSYRTFIHGILPRLPYETTPVFIDIKTYDMEELYEFVSILSEVPELAGIEINLNCPYGNFTVPSCWKDEEKLREMARRVKTAAGNKILWSRAPTAEYPVQQVVATVQGNDGDAFVSSNAIGGYSVGTEIRKFHCRNGGDSRYSGLGVKPYVMIYAHNSSEAAKIPVTGGGDIVCARNVLEYIMAGAYTTQIGPANLIRPDFMKRLIKELEELVGKMNIESLSEIRGYAEYV